MKAIVSARASRPFSWGAVFAGVAVGAVASMAILAIGAFITFLFGLSFSLTGFMGLFWFALSAIVGAFVAGNIAVNAQAPAQADDARYHAVSKSHATLTGGVTAALLVLFTTFFTLSGIGSIIGATASVAGSVGGAIGSAVSGGAQTAAVIGMSGNFNVDDLPNLQKSLGNIDGDDIAKAISNSNDELDKKQVKAIGKVIAKTLKENGEKAEHDLKNMDLTKLDDYLQARYQSVKKQLSDDELVERLQQQGLSEQEATEVQQYLLKEAKQLEQQAEQMVHKAEKAVKKAEAAARSAARWAALSWLISALLTFLATLAGAHSAARRIVRD